VAFLCHDRREEGLAASLDGSVERIVPRSSREYEELARTASVGLANRMHAPVMLAGMGIPSVAVGTDSRLLMVEALGLPCHYVKEARADELEEEIETLLRERRSESRRLLALKEEARVAYREALSCVLP